MWVDQKKKKLQKAFCSLLQQLKENIGIWFLLILIADLGVYLPKLWKGVSMFPFKVDSMCSENAVYLSQLHLDALSVTEENYMHMKYTHSC